MSSQDKNTGGEKSGILKKLEGEEHGKGKGNGKGKKSVSSVRKSVRWDELNVTATLHPVGKDYGHIKVNEVPTPFERPRGVDGVGVDPMVLAKRLEESVRRDSGLSESSQDADDEESMDEAERKRRFKEKRRQHYREFAKLRSSLNSTSDDDVTDNSAKREYRK